MIRGTHASAVVLTAISSVLGFAVAMGKVDLDHSARADQPAATTAEPRRASVERTAASCDGANKAAILALAAHNRTVDAAAQESGKKPNFCIIWGDDIGQSNISAYSHGVMGYQTPNIDRVAREGMMFTDFYAEQS